MESPENSVVRYRLGSAGEPGPSARTGVMGAARDALVGRPQAAAGVAVDNAGAVVGVWDALNLRALAFSLAALAVGRGMHGVA